MRKLSTIGQRLRALRIDSGLSLRDLAKKIDASHMAIAKWEADKVMMGSRHLIALCDVFSIRADWLLSGFERDRETLALCIACAWRVGEISRGRAAELALTIDVPIEMVETEAAKLESLKPT